MSNQGQLKPLASYIAQLLSEYECVVIPGFGGFITNYKSAQIDKVKGIIHPPSRSILFNPLLKQNDGLLLSKIQFDAAISYEETQNWIKKEVDGWKVQLSAQGTLLLTDLGRFSLDHNQSILFNSDRRSLPHMNSFGLKSISAQATKEIGIKSKIKEGIEVRKIDPTYRRNIKAIAYSGVAAALLIAAIIWTVTNRSAITTHSNEFMSIVSNWFTDTADSSANAENAAEEKDNLKESEYLNTKTKEKDKSSLETDKQNFIYIKKPIETELESTVDGSQELDDNHNDLDEFSKSATPIELANKSEEFSEEKQAIVADADKTDTYLNEQPKKEKENSMEKKFKIVAGCFGSLRNAENYTSELQQLGYDAKLSGTSANGLNRVIYAAYNTKIEALKALANIRLSHNPNAWITSD